MLMLLSKLYQDIKQEKIAGWSASVFHYIQKLHREETCFLCTVCMRQYRALSRALKTEKLKAPLSYRPNGAELQMTGGTRCITIQTGIFSYRDQLVLKSF